jgi:hypothetical protein
MQTCNLDEIRGGPDYHSNLSLFPNATVAIPVCRNIEVQGPIGICHNEVQCRGAQGIAVAGADVVIPGHDPEVLLRFPGVIEA